MSGVAMSVRMIVALGFAAALPITAGAQSSIATGDRVRVRRTDGSTLVGTVLEASPSRLRLVREGREVTFTPNGIRSLERSLGLRGAPAKSFFTTIAVSGAVLGAYMAATYQPGSCTDFCIFGSPTDAFKVGVIAGGLIGIP